MVKVVTLQQFNNSTQSNLDVAAKKEKCKRVRCGFVYTSTVPVYITEFIELIEK
jgi:hypothetical protein